MKKLLLCAALACGGLPGMAQATIVLNPSSPGMIAANLGPSNCEAACVYTAFGLTNAPGSADDLVLYYKAEVGKPEEGSFTASYSTTFSNTSNDPEDALIQFISGASSIDCPECYLAIKDGNQNPSYYFYNLSAWNGTETLSLQDFWPQQGAISHVSIWGREGGGQQEEIPEPMTLALVGLGLLAAGSVRRRQRG